MDTAEYKKLHPEHSHLEGDALWDAMEDSLLQGADIAQETEEGVFRWKKGDPDIELSPEDEEMYQKCKKVNEEGDYRVENYTRVFWKAFDKQEKHSHPLHSFKFIMFDTSEEGKDKPPTDWSGNPLDENWNPIIK